MPRLTLPGAIESCVSEVPAPVRAAQLDEVRLATPGWQRSLWLCTQTDLQPVHIGPQPLHTGLQPLSSRRAAASISSGCSLDYRL